MALDSSPAYTSGQRKLSSYINPAILGLIAMIALLLIVGSVFAERFITVGNLINVFRASVVTLLLGLGQTVVILTGSIDLSVGSIISLTGVLVAGLTVDDPGRLIWAGPLVLLFAMLIGLINGLIVVKLRVHSIIVTLGMAAVLQGAALLYSDRPIPGPIQLEDFAFGDILGLPAGSVSSVVLFCIVGLVLARTRLGRKIYAVGGNLSAARLLGLPVDAVICIVFAFSAGCAALTGIYMVGLLGSGSAIAGQGYELTAITPVVLGGTALSGGIGGVGGTALAVVFVCLLNNLLNFLQVSTFYQWIVQGAIILIAVTVFSRKDSKS